MTVATTLARVDSLIPRALSSASAVRKTTVTSTTGSETNSDRQSPPNPRARAATDTTPAASMQNPARNPKNGPQARVA